MLLHLTHNCIYLCRYIVAIPLVTIDKVHYTQFFSSTYLLHHHYTVIMNAMLVTDAGFQLANKGMKF